MNEVMILEKDQIAEFTNGKHSLVALIVGRSKCVNEVVILEKDQIAEFTNGKHSFVR